VKYIREMRMEGGKINNIGNIFWIEVWDEGK
jgi:hypothetical protein